MSLYLTTLNVFFLQQVAPLLWNLRTISESTSSVRGTQMNQIQQTASPPLFWIHPYIIACILTSSKNSESTAIYQFYLEKLCWFLFFQYGKFSLSWVNLLLLFCLYMSVISILSFPRLPGELLGKKISVILYPRPSCATVVWSKILHIIIVPLFHSSGSWACNS